MNFIDNCIMVKNLVFEIFNKKYPDLIFKRIIES
jgi:hypothetical protein